MEARGCAATAPGDALPSSGLCGLCTHGVLTHRPNTRKIKLSTLLSFKGRFDYASDRRTLNLPLHILKYIFSRLVRKLSVR